MRFSTLTALGFACVPLAAAAALDASQDATAVLAELQSQAMAALEAAAPAPEAERKGCSLARASVRQDW